MSREHVFVLTATVACHPWLRRAVHLWPEFERTYILVCVVWNNRVYDRFHFVAYFVTKKHLQ